MKKMPIVKEVIDPPRPNSLPTRNYATHPIPALDDRILLWELQRPLLEPLPEIPNLSEEQLAGILSDGFAANSEIALEDLKEAKAFCIEQVDQAVRPHNPEEVPVSIKQWLQSIKPESVIEIYHELNNQLPERNGLVTEVNDTIANLTGSSNNPLLLGNTHQAKAALFYV